MVRRGMRWPVSGLLTALLLAAGIGAQDHLVSTWQRMEADGGTMRVQLDEDGTATLSVRARVALADAQDLEDTAGLPDSITVSVEAQGTWRVEAGRLRLELTERRLLIDGLPFAQALDTLALRLARSLAVELELPEEGIENLAALVRIGLDDEFDEEASLDEGLGALREPLAYRLDGDLLWLTGADGVERAWTRVVDSAVAPAAWAQVKGGSRTRQERPWTR